MSHSLTMRHLLGVFVLALNLASPVWAQVTEEAAPPAESAADVEVQPEAVEAVNNDPFEGLNRGIYGFNSLLDSYLFRPVARGYVKVVPSGARTSVSLFFSNLFYPKTIVNQFLQGKPREGAADLGRFLINTTVGLAGLFDPATEMGFVRHDEDFGQTLGYWGLGSGPYLVLPLLGPSSLRDAPARVVDYPLNPAGHLDDDDVELALGITSSVSTRANLLSFDRLLEESFDPYAFLREAYLQNRAAAVSDGKRSHDDLQDYEWTAPRTYQPFSRD
ncbi:MAG: MlaA family lipoprotein [Nevskiales bacterium]